ncbi:hypothetical protein OG345_16565 [Streptomyces sp. NBC_01220]|uniref:hypothetical protein n=1 Tax=unclassified Streptomyces TaxID=2593676 RepID=UPI002E29CDA7|nr:MULTISPECIES: hypothetical protein [unclassified Streptomyces]WSQ44500.1 hypothetical protein OG345_16565 [Streptomyces sp. NBC_01220]
MHRVPAVAAAAASLVLLSLVTAGCSGSADSGQAKSGVTSSPAPTQGADEAAYYACLKGEGIPLETTDGGALRVEKGKGNNAALLTAEKKCVGLLPSPSMVPASKEDMARARKLSACLRKHGVKDYPDPAPNGDFPLSNELSYKMKTNPDYRAAREICDPRQPGGEDLSAGG